MEKGGPVLLGFTDQELLEELVRRFVERTRKEQAVVKPNSRWWLKGEVLSKINDATNEMRRVARGHDDLR